MPPAVSPVRDPMPSGTSPPVRQKGEAVGLQISTRVVTDVTIIDLQGRATIGAGNDLLSAHLRQAIEGSARKVLVNLAGCAQVDSSGISTIVRSFVKIGRAHV